MQKIQISSQDQPYEKFLRIGPQSLSERELLAIILRTGTRDASALELAEQVLMLARYPREGLLGLYDVSLNELMAIRGIGTVKAVKLKCLAELAMRINTATAREGLTFDNSASVAAYYMERLRHLDTEQTILACLDSKGQLIAERRLSSGSVRTCVVSPREVFLEALQQRAVNFILLHNHPSGDPTPSAADRRLTQDIRSMGEKLELYLLDHIIIGDRDYFSFREEDWQVGQER